MNRQHRVDMPARRRRGPSRERGMALLIALIVLIVVSILGVAAMRVALFQSRVSVNSQTENLAFQAAESGLNVALTQARNQINAVPPILPSNPAHLFNLAANGQPQRVCQDPDGVTINVYPDGITNADGAPDFTAGSDCPALPGSNATVTTVVGLAPPDSGAGQLQAFDQKYGAGLILIQTRAYGAVPNTNVTSVHAQDWGMLGPSGDSEGG